MAAPRIWPSTAVTVSASAISRITWLIPTPHRLTVYASAAPLPDAPATLVIGRLARPYPSGTFPRRIALTSPSARRLHRNRHSSSPNAERSSVPDLLQPLLPPLPPPSLKLVPCSRGKRRPLRLRRAHRPLATKAS